MNELDNAILVLHAAVVALEAAVKNSEGGATGNQVVRLIEVNATLRTVTHEVFEAFSGRSW